LLLAVTQFCCSLYGYKIAFLFFSEQMSNLLT